MLADQTWPNFEGSEKDGVKVILQNQNLDKDVRYVFLFSFEPKENKFFFYFCPSLKKWVKPNK